MERKAEDKSLILACPLGINTHYAISKGNIFQGQKTNGTWKRYLCPVDIREAITPKPVSDIIRWAVDGRDSVEVLYAVTPVTIDFLQSLVYR